MPLKLGLWTGVPRSLPWRPARRIRPTT